MNNPRKLRRGASINLFFENSVDTSQQSVAVAEADSLVSFSMAALQLANVPPKRTRLLLQPRALPAYQVGSLFSLQPPPRKFTFNSSATIAILQLLYLLSTSNLALYLHTMVKNNRAIGFARSDTSSPPTMPSSSISQAALIHNSVDMSALSFEEYLSRANSGGNSGNEHASPGATSTEEAGSAVSDQDTPMTGAEISLPGKTALPSETGSSKLREKLLAARKPAPSSGNKSSPLKNASVGDKKANATVETDLESTKDFSIVDKLILHFPELSKATSKAVIVNIIILSDFLNTNSPTDSLGVQPIDYAQIEFLADSILARSATHSQVQATKKEVILDTNLGGEKNIAAKIEDPVAMQEEKVRTLYQVLSKELNARFPPDPAADPVMSADDEEAIFRENAAHLKITISLNLSMFQEDAKLHVDLLTFDREEENLRLMKEAAENARLKEETHAEIIRRNMEFLAQDPPMPALPFEEDYVERYSNHEDMAKMKNMLNPNGPLEAESAGRNGAGDADGVLGAHDDDYFYSFGK
ncbi:hypothetical protein BKA64DRAFT_704103 [Cadophora sp. MPI-SDFR-AT-0126]|nr:hypothetical protein BKA64DRAFT_704103 [Leotiomycetes sp. MPI-SDFR-AT-0126]